MPTTKFPCSVCFKTVNDGNSIFCDFCNLWTHLKCSGLSTAEFLSFSNSASKWYCPKCLFDHLPFKIESETCSSGVMSPDLISLTQKLNLVSEQCQNNCLDIENIQAADCKYYEISDFNKLISDKGPFSFSSFHLNIASLALHFDVLTTLLSQCNLLFDIIAITETRFVKGVKPSFDFNLNGYHEPVYTPTEASVGGALLYISHNVPFETRHDFNSMLYSPSLLESVFVEISVSNSPNIIAGSIYKHPSLSTEEFNSNFLEPFLIKASKENKQILLLGDFNINLLHSSSDRNTLSFLNNLGSHLIIPNIFLPTRITDHSMTLIDNIFSSITGFDSFSGNFLYSISDHLPQFHLLRRPPSTQPKQQNMQRKDWKNFDQENFVLDFLAINWDTELYNIDDVDHAFEVFNSKIQNLIDLHVPTVNISKRQHKTRLKPWITPGIIKSISKRNFFYRKFIKTNDPTLKSFFHHRFKSYRNSILSLTRRSKTNHFSNYFSLHASNMQKVWKGIKEIIGSSSSKSKF